MVGDSEAQVSGEERGPLEQAPDVGRGGSSTANSADYRATAEQEGANASAPRNRSGHVTIHDVANAAGVSIGTVSRVLNRRDGVSPTTNARVLAAVESLGYRPDLAARELSNRRPVTVGLSTAFGHRRLIPYFMLFLEHLMEELASSGLRLRDVPTGDDGLPAEALDAYMLFGAHADDPRIADLERRGVPFVLVGQRDGVRSVAADDVVGGRLAAEHLLRLGHRRALHVTGDLQSQVMGDRADAFFAAFAAADMPKPRLVECDELSALGAYRAMARDLRELPIDAGGQPRASGQPHAATFPSNGAAATNDYTAIFAATDELATGVIAALNDSGARVPADVSVIGFDDMPEIGDRLTTIRQDVAAVARIAVELLHEALNGAPIRGVRVPVSLVVRGTTAERR